MTDSSKFTFSLAIRGFYVYRHSWTPHIGQQLQTESHAIDRARYTRMHAYITHCTYYTTELLPPHPLNDIPFMYIIKCSYYQGRLLFSSAYSKCGYYLRVATIRINTVTRLCGQHSKSTTTCSCQSQLTTSLITPATRK